MKKVSLVLVLACAFLLIAGGTAFAEEPLYTENAQCIECHGADLGGPATKKVDFGVGAVNKETACVKCHWQPRHTTHASNTESCSCHGQFSQNRVDLYVGLRSTPYGYFSYQSSPSAATAQELHEIHANGSWPAGIATIKATSVAFGSSPLCGSCHGAATCDSCHEAAAAHGDHVALDPAYQPVVRTVAPGATSSQPRQDTRYSEQSYCVNAACHPANAAQTARSETVYPHTALTYTGTVSRFAMFTQMRSGAVATIQVVGGGDIALYAYGLNSGAIAEVTVDSDQPVYIDTSMVDTYDQGTVENDGFRVAKDLPSGTHTVTIRNTGLRNPLSTGFDVLLMSVRISDRAAMVGFVPFCGSCHAEQTLAHGYETADHVAADGALSGTACSACHALDLSTEHNKATSSSAALQCDTCHTTPRDTVGAWDQSCVTGGCHTAASSAPMHSASGTAHAVVPAGEICLTCHEGTDLESVHATALIEATGATGCFVCHGGETAPATSDCTVCHFTFENHYDGVAHTSTWDLANCNAAGCHSTRDLMGAHTEKNAAFACMDCHGSTAPGVITAINDGITACGACHEGTIQTSGHYAVHMANPLLRDGSGANYGYYTGSASTQPTGDCSGCHTSNLIDEHTGIPSPIEGWILEPRYDSNGAALTCATCHNLLDATVGSAIAQGFTKCEACHAVHAPIPAAHASTFVASPEVDCSPCHSSVLSVEHNGGYTTITPSGAALTGCDVCHANHEAPRGPIVQAAISETNSTLCSACHEVAHPDFGSHQASSAASLGCAGTGCHDDFGSPIDVKAVHAGADAGPCAVCHTRSDRVPNITLESAECASCHATEGTDYHAELAAVHQAPDSSSCVACHETTDVRSIHTCATCHNATVDTSGTTQCASAACHGTAYPVNDPNHYPVTTHTATETGCNQCHSMDMRTEHAKSTVNVTCVQCHENKVDNFTAPWDKTCAACHPTTHGDKTAKHTALESPDCARCHDKDLMVGVNVEPVHASASQGECAVCHVSSARVPNITAETAECASCHATTAVDYHREMNDKHAFGGIDASCITAGCHVSSSLPAEHARFLGRYPTYADTCALCHLNTNTARINWASATADCSTCHTVHGDIAVIHQAPDSSACVACHETTDVRSIHTCATCHNATVDTSGTTQCASAACHGTAYPVNDPNHYPVTTHTATETGCNQCHSMDMKTEHAKSTVNVTCVQCHETKVDYFTAAWNKTCAACHPTKHGDQNNKHKSTNTSCAGVGCHEITNAESIHRALSGSGCYVCHKSSTQPAITTNCTAAGCHESVGTDHHAAHDGQTVNGAGCEGCHFRYLDDEHAALGLTCATCHASADTKVKAAIAAGDVGCLTCHPDSAHNARQAIEFGAGNASLHRVSEGLPGMRSSFVVNGSTYTWSLPSASSFLKTGWTTSSMMTCASCHTYSGATGPHGATMKINIDPAYPNSFKVVSGTSSIAQLSPNSATGMSRSNGGSTAAGIICEKCHDLSSGTGSWSNIVHKEHDDRGNEGGYCNFCHTSIPHGWGRPRLIGYTTDDAAHRTYNGGIQRMTLKSYTPNGWSKSDCGAGCSSSRHPLSGSSWPNVMSAVPGATTGNVSGKVTLSGSTTAVGGATVTIGTKTTTTATDGTYSITALNAGTNTVSVTKTGYANYSGSVTVTSGSTTPHNVALQIATTTGNVSGTVVDAQSSGAIGSATVTVGTKTATTASNGTYSITGLSAGSYTVTVSKTGYTNYSSTVSVTSGSTTTHNVSLQPVSATNLALGRPFTASRYEGSSYTPAKAGDGSTSSYWWSDNNGSSYATEWLRVDLGSTTSISKVEIAWYGSYYARSFKVYTSTDGSNWSEVHATTSGTSGTTPVTFSSRNARYVRLECTRTGSGNSNGYGVAELRVFQ